jgi:chromosome segregation ATPase
MNFLGYTSTSSLREKEELVEKLLDANTQFHKANGSLKTHVARLKDQRAQVGDLTEETHRLKQEIEGLKKKAMHTGKTLNEKNLALNRQISEFKKVSKVFKERGEIITRLKGELHETCGDNDELNDKVRELTEELKKVNDRYDAFVTVSGTNFASHVDRVLKKRKVGE